MAERIELLCGIVAADQEAFQEKAAEYGVAGELDRIISAVRAGADPGLLAGDLDALDEAFAQHGIDNLTRNHRSYRPVPGAGDHPVVTVWVCPARRPCPRLIPDDGAEEAPMCALASRRLTRKKLDSR